MGQPYLIALWRKDTSFIENRKIIQDIITMGLKSDDSELESKEISGACRSQIIKHLQTVYYCLKKKKLFLAIMQKYL